MAKKATADGKKKPAPKKPRAKAQKPAIEQNVTAQAKPMGRPTAYTPELGQVICDLIADRVPLVDICAREDMPDKATFYRWRAKHEDFRDNYARAREDRADARQDHIDEIIKKLVAGEIKPDVARVIIDAEKWQMGKEKPKSYGDKVALTDPDGGALTVRFTH